MLTVYSGSFLQKIMVLFHDLLLKKQLVHQTKQVIRAFLFHLNKPKNAGSLSHSQQSYLSSKIDNDI